MRFATLHRQRPSVPRFRGARPIAGAALLAALLSCQPAEKDSPTGLIVLSFCSIRADHMSCYGYARETTPNLDAFAREAALFETAVAPWPKTSPSFCSIMTGTYPHRNGVMWKTAGVRLADENVTLAEILRERGYATAAFVSSGALSGHLNIQQGFDHFEETWKQDARRSYPLSVRYDRTALRALEWLDEREEGPFFLWAHFNNAHYPYKPPAELAAPFIGDSLYRDTLTVDVAIEGFRDIELPPGHPNSGQVLHNDLGTIPKRSALPVAPGSRDYRGDLAHYIAQYDGGIRWADRSAGILLDGLRERNLLDDVVVVVVGDHGESLGDHDFYFEHGRFPYEACARVPLLIRYPSLIEPGSRPAGPVGTFATTPTVLEILGVPVPGTVDSRSLLPHLRGGPAPERVVSESGYEPAFQVSLREGTWKLIHVPESRDRSIMRGGEFELYDLARDPKERKDLCAERPEIAARLRERLEEWSAEWGRGTEGAAPGDTVGLDEATRENLRAMGYLK
ncbi:MAG: sulfatase [Candidatus Eisenbacteria bacterium]|nr:sulfatase [Candidatus Eisenbacteria bacterium]